MQLGQGLAGPFISSWLLGRHYRKQWKRQVFAQLVGNRHLLTPALMGTSSHEPYIALNQAFVAFADSPSVIDALRKYHAELDLPGQDRNTNNLVALIKEMAKSAGVRFDRLDDFFITHPFTPPSSPESESQGDLTQERQKEIQQIVDSHLEHALLWEFRYLNYFLVRGTQMVLDWLVNCQRPIAAAHYDSTWLPAIPSANDRRTIISVLQGHHLIACDEPSDMITATPKGFQYQQWRGPLPPLPDTSAGTS